MDFRGSLKSLQCGIYEAKNDLLDSYPHFFLVAHFKTFAHKTKLYDTKNDKIYTP
ncbi:hypothetical protein [Helicobacter macacae]|uniref:Uncharacterized protein n=1 Tax=Helicobacter macacae MIT 99-5501 TaxID=1357400 RepID=V8C6M2_9HELI|nr:hypothetical protein [Helicobacter macacae]ETD22994.1 hypothetical protein HMPREF2086_01440 [Helicobacter macacae MIT 99-5501]